MLKTLQIFATMFAVATVLLTILVFDVEVAEPTTCSFDADCGCLCKSTGDSCSGAGSGSGCLCTCDGGKTESFCRCPQ